MVPAYTKTGFAKFPQPPEVKKLLSEFYQQHKQNRVIEPWHRVDTAINFESVHTGMVFLPDNIRHRVAEIMAPIMEQWAGRKLTFTALYGIREYYRGSILKKHVDRLETHVISVILNVYQEVDEPWELEVMDFNGNLQNIPQEAGEMVFYESAKLLHGRPLPLKGNVYANCFLHYMPAEGWVGQYAHSGNGFIRAVDQVNFFYYFFIVLCIFKFF